MSLRPLILVVGPSGAGKDSLLDGAKRALAGDPGFHFARRVVTRPCVPGTEDHDSLTPDAFVAARAAGAFLLDWAAHGLRYGVPMAAQAAREAGAAVVANVSRAVIDDARARLAPVAVVLVTAPDAVLAERLAGRGRESAEAIRGRLARAAAPPPSGSDVRVVMNDRSLTEGVDAFVGILRDLAAR